MTLRLLEKWLTPDMVAKNLKDFDSPFLIYGNGCSVNSTYGIIIHSYPCMCPYTDEKQITLWRIAH